MYLKVHTLLYNTVTGKPDLPNLASMNYFDNILKTDTLKLNHGNQYANAI